MKVGKYPAAPLFMFIRLLRINGGIHFSKLLHLIPWAIRYTLLEPFRLYERWKYEKRIRKHRLHKPPIFVLGHWRSGTSFLQQLLSLDPNMQTTNLFQSIFPECYISTEAWLKPFLNRISSYLNLRYEIQRVPMEWDLPAEEEIGLLCATSPSSYSWGHIFSQKFEYWLAQNILMEAGEGAKADEFLEAYAYSAQKLSFHTPNKRLVLKSPGNTARIRLLLQLYPHAKFVYIHRNPIDVFHSTRLLWKIIQTQSSLHSISEEEITRLSIIGYKEILTAYVDQRELIPEGNLVEISYEELREFPIQKLKEIYDSLGLGEFSSKPVEPFCQSSKTYKSNQYKCTPELKAKLQKEWPFAFENGQLNYSFFEEKLS